ncbi:peptide ABC transporter permease [Micromonospora globispora]|uniref:Peptide ABC transporter permease n=1 Tax=Micromonospora globispora TaxID=1450148 RepID=A0A317JUL0_9ACTN|nr:ABC transporter permease [Micromonospora globispora]PWU44305.1 peptide ABC transporter permease [Micromonospora globispora]RQW94053.1 peptide ABC transporter permease [Micromonospora globispora]
MTVGPVTSPTETQPAEETPAVPGTVIEGRSLGRIAWTRLKRDRVALAGGITVFLLILVAILAPLINKAFGHPVNEYHQDKIDPNLGGIPPVGTWGGISSDFLLGVQPVTGRDLFSQVIYGAQTSLLIAFAATLLAVAIGIVVGVSAGFFGGWLDSLFSRFMDLILAFPLILFAIALISVLPPTRAFRTAVMIVVIGGFSWPYIGRIVRGQTLSLREREFVESARSIGASNFRIIFKELLPNLAAPILVYSTLIIPTNILFEAALSFLGVGVPPPTPSWGRLLSDAVQFYEYDPMYMFVPGMAIFITVLAFNLFGDGLRDALDPKANR